MRTAVCTIVLKRDLAYARVLMRSLSEFHPDWEQHVVLADRADGCFDPAHEPFAVIEARHLPFPDKQGTLFYYDPSELEAALKPWILGWLLDTRGFDRAVYLTSRAWALGPIDVLPDALEAGAPLSVTPRLLGEVRDARSPGEWDILQWGVHDTGALAIARNGTATRDLLAWWQARSHRHFHGSAFSGGSGDARWLDLAVARWPVAIVRDPTFDVAFWNLGERTLDVADDEYRIDGRPLSLFQFAGFDPETPHRLSRADHRFADAPPEPIRRLSSEYVGALVSAGHRSCRYWPFAYDRYANGDPVCAPARALYRNDPATRIDCGADPFQTGPGPFNRPMNRQACVTRLMGEIWRSRPDLQREFPDLDGQDARRFAMWFVSTAERECRVGAAHIDVVRRALGQTPEVGASTTRPVPPPALKSLEAFPPARMVSGLASRARIQGLVKSLRPLLDLRGRARAMLAPAPPPPERSSSHTTSNPLGAPLGLNITGYFTADLGVGQSVRAAAVAAETAGIECSMIDFAMGTISPKTDHTFAGKLSLHGKYAVNLVHVNADQFPSFRRAMGPDFFIGKRTIGYWAWELPELPDEWLPSFDGLSEVWVPSRFVQSAVSQKAPVPVVLMPHPVVVPSTTPSRARFGLPDEGFLFLTMYDLLSYQERKNPAATIAAFRKAFPEGGQARLVVKVLNADRCPDDVQALRASLADLPGAILLSSTLSRQEAYDLEATCDAFVSLHRAEGFGLATAECMYMGKPVIGTNWSGNTDYMTARNSCPVAYDLVELDRDHGPYKKGQRWAEPDADHAAWHMRSLVADPALASRIGALARATMLADYSPLSVGRRYRARLERIRALTD